MDEARHLTVGSGRRVGHRRAARRILERRMLGLVRDPLALRQLAPIPHRRIMRAGCDNDDGRYSPSR
jgi:hypothetical protein